MLLQEQTSWLLSCSYPSELDRPAGQGAIAGSFESRPLEACSCENANNVEKKNFLLLLSLMTAGQQSVERASSLAFRLAVDRQ